MKYRSQAERRLEQGVDRGLRRMDMMLRDRLDKAIQRLPVSYQVLVNGHYLKGMRYEDLDLVIEGVADDTLDPGVDVHAHLASCSLCQRRLQAARAIHELLSTREAPVPPLGFTARVIAQVQRQRWQAERATDIGFNVAVAAGILLILGGGLGLAWSMGFLSLDVNLGVLLEAGAAEWTGRLVPQIQTIAMAAVLLTMALGLWWWAETDLSL